ncbi:MAG: ferritin family protein [Planctomycetes bacterium]|nr:ferritin family protein [Planctomycetota bacterium]MBL7106807.1 ferritin family protein [Phycisphaerae bacterium]
MGELEVDVEIIEYAINREKHAYNFYKALSEHVTSERLSEVFAAFAEEEKGHKERLEFELMKQGLTVRDDSDSEEANGREYGLEEGVKVDMDYEDALVVAISKEDLAFRFYVEQAGKVSEKGSKEVLLALAQEEARHKLRFEQELELLHGE